MAERNTYESLQAGMASAKAADSQFDPMKGRTYIPRMSPETTKAIIEAIRARRKKKADEKTAERKSASDDYFAGEADKAMAAERKRESDKEMAGIADRRMSEIAEQADIDATDRESAMEAERLLGYGYEGRNAINKRRGVESEVRSRDAEARANKKKPISLSDYGVRLYNEYNSKLKKEGKDPISRAEFWIKNRLSLPGEELYDSPFKRKAKETSTQREEREERRKQQEVRDLDREDITSEEIEQEELNRRNPLLAMQLRLAEEQRFREKPNIVQDQKNFSENRANIRAYRSGRSLNQASNENLGDLTVPRNTRIFQDIQRRNMLRKARAENAARNIRRYRP